MSIKKQSQVITAYEMYYTILVSPFGLSCLLIGIVFNSKTLKPIKEWVFLLRFFFFFFFSKKANAILLNVTFLCNRKELIKHLKFQKN